MPGPHFDDEDKGLNVFKIRLGTKLTKVEFKW